MGQEAVELRPLSTDRPDTTESAYSVDAGHVQVEMSMVDVTRDGGGTSVGVAPFLVKIGLLHWMDLQLGMDPFLHSRTGGASASGVGDGMVRLKMNLWGNDEGATALVVMPFVKVPMASSGFGNGRVEGGVIVPFAVGLPGDVSVGLMPEVDLVRNTADDGYAVDLVHTATASHAIVKDLGGYVEYAGFANLAAEEAYRGYLDGGLTLGFGDDVQLDGGGRVGLTPAAEDLGLFVGLSFRR